jgi:hypothetical protein
MASINNRPERKWAPGEIQAYAMLMVEFLRLSPSYTLAGQLLASDLAEEEQIQRVTDLYRMDAGDPSPLEALWADFQTVFKTYQEFGDITSRDFETWWREIGLDLFGADEPRPRVSVLARTGGDNSSPADIAKRISSVAQQSASRGHLVVAIPMGLPKSRQLAMLSKVLDQYPSNPKPPAARSPRPFAAQRLREAPLRKSIGVLWARAMNPKMPLWQIGVICKVSEKYSAQIAKVGAKLTDANFDVRNSLTILTHRMLTRAQLIAENAAHGVFPSHEKRVLPVFDYNVASKRLISYKPRLKKSRM